MHRIIKKTNYCSNCGFLDTNSFCRKGLGWEYIKDPKISYCSDQWPIRPFRCGTCRRFVLSECVTDSTLFPTCSRFRKFVNFYDCCPWYEYEKGKNIRPKADEIPSKLKEIWQL